MAVAALLMTLGVVATLGAWRDIFHIAMNDEEHSHILLVPLVAAWLLWVRRQRLRKYAPQATWVGPVFVAAGWLLNRIGDDHSIQSFWHFGAIVVVVGCFLSVAGGALLTRLLPVFASLCFMVPVPGRVRQAVALPLQAATARVTQSVLETMGVAVERSGNVLRIAQKDVEVAQPCNGLRMVFALFMVSFLVAYSSPLRNRVRVLVLLASPVAAIAFNVLRLAPTVWAFGALSPDIASSVHEIGGWAMLPCMFLTMLGTLRVLRWAQIPVMRFTLAHGV